MKAQQLAQIEARQQTKPMTQKKTVRKTGEAFLHTILIILSILTLLPFLLLVSNAFKTSSELLQNPFGIPLHPTLQNLADAWSQGNYGQAYLNSFIVAVFCVIVVAIVAGFAAYALALIPFKGSNAIMAFLLFTLSIPLGMFLVPLFFMWQRLGLMNSLTGLIIIYCGIYLTFNIFLLRSFFLGVPATLRESAMIDGANELQVFFKIFLPIAKPVFLSSALIVVVWTWNEFFFANAFIQNDATRTVAVKYITFTGSYASNWSLISAGGLISVLPILIAFLFLQRRFIEGIVDGSVK